NHLTQVVPPSHPARRFPELREAERSVSTPAGLGNASPRCVAASRAHVDLSLLSSDGKHLAGRVSHQAAAAAALLRVTCWGIWVGRAQGCLTIAETNSMKVETR